MTKHICDKCGKECSAPTMWDVGCDARNTETYFHFEICSECMMKLKNFFISKAESEDYDNNIGFVNGLKKANEQLAEDFNKKADKGRK